jgi:hypothetical protein
VGTLSSAGKKLELQPRVEKAVLAALVQRTALLLLTEGKTHWSLETIDGIPAVDHSRTPELLESGFRPHGEKLLFWKAP